MTYFFSFSAILGESIFSPSYDKNSFRSNQEDQPHWESRGCQYFPVRDRSRPLKTLMTPRQPAFPAFEQIRWRIPNLDHFMDTLNVQLGHGVEDHEGRGPPDLTRNVLHVHKDINQSIPDPT
jgi:hypothetical protein